MQYLFDVFAPSLKSHSATLFSRWLQQYDSIESAVTENVNAVRDVSARRPAVIMVVIDRRVCRLGRPEQRPDDTRNIQKYQHGKMQTDAPSTLE